MERRKALVIASAATLVLGTGIVALASVSGASLLGFGGSSASANAPGSFQPNGADRQHVVVKTHNLYDKYVIATDPGSTAAPSGSAHASQSASTGSPVASPTTVAAAPTGPAVTPSTSAGAPQTEHPTPTTQPDDGSPSTSPGTVAPTPSTTIPTTSTTWPRGVPDDWPPGKAIPPEPVPCHGAELTLDGVWHCENGDD